VPLAFTPELGVSTGTCKIPSRAVLLDRYFAPAYSVDGKQGSARLGKECSPNVSMNDHFALVSLPEISPGHFGDLAKASLPLVLPVSDKAAV
jgi:hypothetical protein